MRLKPSSIQDLAPKALPYMVSDGNGLYLQVQPSGARYWRFRFRWAGVGNTLSCGVYPEVTLDEARSNRDGFKALILQGINPSEHVKASKSAKQSDESRKLCAHRFALDSDGAISFILGKRVFALSPSETAELRIFLDATRAVTPKVTPCL